MKKTLSLLLAVLMMLAVLVACDTTTPSTGDSTTEAPTTEAPTTTEEQTTEAELAKDDISKGSREGNVYKNEFLGFEFTKPDSWVFSTDEEIAAAMNLAVDQILGDNFKEALKKNPAIYDMMVVDSITRTNINVVYENLQLSFSSNITEAQYIDAVKAQLANISGMEVTFSETLEKVNLGKTEFTKCVCETKTNGVSMTQVFYLRNIDGYMACVIVTIASGYTVADIEAMFK